MKSAKQEILRSLTELKEKGVEIKFHSSFIQVHTVNGLTFTGSVSGSGSTFMVLPAPKDIVIDIYINSSEQDIMNKIIAAKNAVKNYEEIVQVSAIVEFLREELK
jgi:hypothetical protein